MQTRQTQILNIMRESIATGHRFEDVSKRLVPDITFAEVIDAMRVIEDD